jgi:hypothetical protein
MEPNKNEKLVILPAISRKEPHNDIAHGFLNECIKLSGGNEKQVYVLTQYSNLLKSIEGEKNDST